MSTTERPGTLGGNQFYLRQDRDQPYVRLKVPVLPGRSDIEGDAAGVSPDPLVRTWSQSDFSSGAGFPQWTDDQSGFDMARQVVWDTIEEVLQPSPRMAQLDSFTDGGAFFTFLQRVATSANGGSDYVDVGSGLPTWTTTGKSVKAASDPHTVRAVSDAGTIKLVSSYTNGDVYLDAAVWKATGFSNVVVTTFGELAYFLSATTLERMDGFAVATSTVVETTAYNMFHAAATNHSILTTSDVGPVWLQKDGNLEISLWQYNEADDSVERLGVIPQGGQAISVLFAFDGYWVPYLQHVGTDAKTMWLWFLINGIQGRVGPFRSTVAGATGVPHVIGVTDQNEIAILWNDQVFTYDVDTTSLNVLIDTNDDTVSGSTGITRGFAWGDVIALTHDNGKVAVYPRSSTRTATPALTYVDLGAWDGGYPGVEKRLESVTITTKPLVAGQVVQLEHRFDGGSWRSLAQAHNTEGATTYTWYPSLLSGPEEGVLCQLRLKLTSTAVNTGPYVRSVSAAVLPNESYVEFVLEIDLGTARAGQVDSKRTADWLWALDGNTVFVNPWDVRDVDAAVSHNVKVLERTLGPVGRDGPQYARVRLRQVERV